MMENLINEFEGKRVLIVGDVMIDAYIMGKVERISPEAPVPVVNIYTALILLRVCILSV